MYNLNIESKIGDLIKVEEYSKDKVYEVAAVSVNIYVNEYTGEEEFSVLIEAVDIKSPLGDYYIIDEEMTRLAEDAEVLKYLEKDDDLDSLLERNEEIFDFFGKKDFFKSDNTFFNPLLEEDLKEEWESFDVFSQSEESQYEESPRTADDVLDEYSDIKALIELVGASKEYEDKLRRLEKELIEITAK